MDVELPDGTVVQGVPENITRPQLAMRLSANGMKVPAEWMRPDKPEADAASGAVQAGLSMLSSATTGLLGRAGGTIGGIAGSIASGKFGTQEGAQLAGDIANETARKFTYQPESEAGKSALESIGRLFEASKLGGLGPAETFALGGIAPAARPAVPQVRAAVTRALAKDIPDEAMGVVSGVPANTRFGTVGGAGVAEDTLRRTQAASLPVPVKLTKGQATRDFADQQFERETAKNPTVGEPLRQRFAEQNQQILQNFDAWLDKTGAEAGSLRATGEAVSKAVVEKSNKAKSEIRAAYKRAAETGAMSEEIDLAPLRTYLEEHKPEAINATVLATAEAKLDQLSGGRPTMPIGALEEVRKAVGKVSGKDATNATFGAEVKNVIDGLTDGKGGEAYKQARAMRFRYGEEFERQGVVDKLLSKKPGTNDRAVAFEDVFDHSILKGSLDDVRAMRKTLQTAGPEGQQAWRELQGATIKHLKDEITKSVAPDINGNQVVSPARLNALVTALDKDGKLDFIFGKQGAQQIRDVNGIAKDVFTSPPGSVNHSNTTSVLVMMLDKLAGKTTGIPGLGWATGAAAKEVQNAGLRKRVRESLAEPPP